MKAFASGEVPRLANVRLSSVPQTRQEWLELIRLSIIRVFEIASWLN
jgi:hypothetical protein